MAKRKAAKRSYFTIWVTLGVVALIVAVGAVVVVGNNAQTTPAVSPAAAAVDQESGAITIGESENVIEEYLDFMCPFCGTYYRDSNAVVSERVAAGELQLELHPISILNNTSQGTAYSTRAANAVYCVADDSTDAIYPFVDQLFENQPNEGSPGLTDEQLLTLAERAGASSAVESCIADQTYGGFVEEKTEETPVMPGNGGISTPTVLVNGEFINVANDISTEIDSRIN